MGIFSNKVIVLGNGQVRLHQTLNLLRQCQMTDCYLPLSFICLMLLKVIEVLLVGVRMSLV